MKKFLLLSLLAASSSATALSATDTTFLAKAVRGNNYGIEAAKLALKMSRPAVNRNYARQMIADHAALGAQVKAAVIRATPGMKLPVTVTYKQWDMLQALKTSGWNFDRLYRQQMINSHRETYNLFNRHSQSEAANPGLRAVITAAKPKVHMHWNHAFNLAH
ncbi:DUF4142 domain-containing protein [Deinococcus fonticola]|uniref:DUF4142 domain-containing protein n=1 Tax=Deinococcus fonticola TaxID=2528713 RepID=UPI001074DC61|nr:DUF4142 domain-containing protein [Deinococcus fonticola]